MITGFKNLPDYFDHETKIRILYKTETKMTIHALEASHESLIFTLKVPKRAEWKDVKTGQILSITREKYMGGGSQSDIEFAKLNICKEKPEPHSVGLLEKIDLQIGSDLVPEVVPIRSMTESTTEDKPEESPILDVDKAKEELEEAYATLNEGQKKAYDGILEHSENKLFYITGSPGVGKSYLAKTIMLKYKIDKLTISPVAPSHKAKKVLSDMLGEYATTVARFCGYTMENSDNPVMNDNGEFVKTRNTERVDVVIADEVSMISNHNFQEILEATRQVVIAMGDKNQLQAINTESADLSDAIVFELTEQMRQDKTDTALYKNIQMIKRKIEGSDEEVVYEFDETFIKSENLLENRLKNQVDIIVSYRNIFVDAYNNEIQKKLTGDIIPIEGDLVLLNKPLYATEPTATANGKKIYPILQNNGDGIRIIKIHKTQPTVGMIVDIDGLGEGNETRLLLTREDWARQSFVYELWQKTWRSHMEWKAFVRFTLNVSLPYAVTAHKVQGSTYNRVGVNIADMNAAWKLNDKYRMIYVALSRAKEKCYVKIA